MLDLSNPKPGVYLDLDIDSYHQSAGVSRSTLKVLEEGTPLDCWHYMEHGLKETDDMRLGSAVDMLVFEPELVSTRMAVRPKFRQTKADKEARAEWEDRNRGKLIVSESQREHAQAMADAVKGAKSVRALMANAGAQQSFYWPDKDTGELCKCRPDGYDPTEGWSFDLKTVAGRGNPDLSTRSLTTRIVDGAYEAQAAMCCDGIRANGLPWNGHVIVWVAKSAPFDVRCQLMEPGGTWHTLGEARTMRWLRKFSECRKANHWPGYSETIAPIAAPKWVAMKLEQEEELERAQRREAS